jgi:hypothetical protein
MEGAELNSALILEGRPQACRLKKKKKRVISSIETHINTHTLCWMSNILSFSNNQFFS